MAYVGTLAINVVANTAQFRSGLQTASRDVAVFTGTVQKSTRAMAPFSAMMGVGLGVGAAAGLLKMGKAANQFQGEMNRSLAIMQDVGPGMRKEMELTAHFVAAKTQFSAKEAGKAYFYLASAGMDAASSVKALGVVARFGQAGNFDLATATDLATDAQSALGLKSKDTATNIKNLTRVTDVLVKANTIANASVQQFSEAITNKAGVAARMYGVSIEETTAVLAAFADQGIKGAEAGTKFGIVMRDLTTKAITNEAAFKRLGLAVFDASGNLLPLADIIERLEVRFSGLSDKMRKSTLLQAGFTDKSVSGLQALIGYSAQIREWEELLNKAGGTTKDVSDNVLTDFDKAWNKVTASMTVASTEGFAPILDQLATMTDRLGEAANGFDKLEKSSRRWGNTGKAVAAGMWVAGKVFDVASILPGMAGYVARNALTPPGQKQDPVKEGEKWLREFFGRPDMRPRNAAGALAQRWGVRADALGGGDRTGLAGLSAKHKAERQVQEEWNDRLRADYEKLFESGVGRRSFGREAREDSRVAYAMRQGAERGRESMRQGTERRREFDKVSDAAANAKEKIRQLGLAMTAATRTPMEKYEAKIKDISSLFRQGAISADTAARAILQAESEMGAGGGSEPTFAPAMLRGSLEAYETIIRAASPDQMQGQRDKELALLEWLKELPHVRRALEERRDKETALLTVEVPP